METSLVRDRFGQYHVKPCPYGDPSSNDGLIVTAYAKKVELPYTIPWMMWNRLAHRNHLPIERTPGKPTPYPSRDFFLGASGMDMWFLQVMKDWCFSPIELPPFDPFQLVEELLKMRPSFITKKEWEEWKENFTEPGNPVNIFKWVLVFKHRNYFWKAQLTQLYRFAFRIPLADRAFHLRVHRQKVPFIYQAIEWVDKKIPASSNSSKLIKWLKYDIEPEVKVFEEYFGMEHPITESYKHWKKK